MICHKLCLSLQISTYFFLNFYILFSKDLSKAIKKCVKLTNHNFKKHSTEIYSELENGEQNTF